jgi:predicted nucleic acid-binding Zn ribbon protein
MNKKPLCPVCGEPILGRIDKKFCSDQCRNTFNNRRYSAGNGFVQKINRTLKKNHSILSMLNTNGKTKVSRSKLLNEGFDFNYFTNIYETQKGNTYKICYNEGYLVLSDESVLLIHWKEDV